MAASTGDRDPGRLTERFGTAKRPDRDVMHARPDGASDEIVAALGKLSEALEAVEDARGHLYAFHRLSGRADLTLQDAVAELRSAGAGALADDIDQALVGRDVIAGRWSFELVEDYDAGYWSVFRAVEEHARNALGFTEAHVYEAEMKHREQGG